MTRKFRLSCSRIRTVRSHIGTRRRAEVLVVRRAALVGLNRRPHQSWLDKVLIEHIDAARVVLNPDPEGKEGQVLV